MELSASPHRSHWIQSPFDHAQTLHPPSGQGLVTLAIHDGQWREWPIPVQDAPIVAQSLVNRPNVYIAQNRFRGKRRLRASHNVAVVKPFCGGLEPVRPVSGRLRARCTRKSDSSPRVMGRIS